MIIYIYTYIFIYFIVIWVGNLHYNLVCLIYLTIANSGSKLNRAYKKLSAVEAWENSKRAAVEAELKNIEVKIMQLINSL